MLRHMRLNEHGATFGIEPRRQPIEQDFNRVLLHLRSVGVISREGMPIGDKKEALVFILHAHPVLQRADIVAEMQLARRAHAAQNALPSLGLGNHPSLSIRSKPSMNGEKSALITPGARYTKAISPMKPIMS